MDKREKGKFKIVSLILLLIIVICPINVHAAKLNKKSITLLKGKSYTLKMTGTKKKATWKTNRKAVARIVNKKKTSVRIKAVRAGKAVVTAKVNRKTYKCNVRVVDPKINCKKVTLTVGENKILKVKGGTGKITWKSSNTNVAIVSNGKVIAKSSGTVTITAIQNKKKLICLVNVKKSANNDSSKDNGSTGNSNESNPSPIAPTEKKVWVVTEKAWIEYIPVYEETPYIECLTCHATFEGNDMGEAYDKHEAWHMDNEEEGRYSVKVRRVLIREDRVDHPEKGYWKTIYE